MDGGSNHSFLSERALSESHRDILNSKSVCIEYTSFRITSATGVVFEKCPVIKLKIQVGNYSGFANFVLSRNVCKELVLGRVFLFSNGVLVDQESSSLVIGGVRIGTHSLSTDFETASPESKRSASLVDTCSNSCKTLPSLGIDPSNSCTIAQDCSVAAYSQKLVPFKLVFDYNALHNGDRSLGKSVHDPKSAKLLQHYELQRLRRIFQRK